MTNSNTNPTGGQQTIKAMVQQAPEGVQTVFDLRDSIIQDANGKARKVPTLCIERRSLAPEKVEAPDLSRTPPAAHTFYAVSGFIDYVRRYGSDETVVLINPARRTVQAILAEPVHAQVNDAEDHIGNVGGRAVVTLVPQFHPRWEPWQELLNAVMPIDKFVNFLRCNRRSIVEPDGRELTLTLAQIRCSTEILLHRGSGKSAVNGIVVRTNIRGKEDSEHVELPESIKLRTPLWVDQDPMDIELDLILNGSPDGTNVTAQIASADIREAEVEAFDKLTETLRDSLKDSSYTIAHGSVGQGSWISEEAGVRF